MPIGINGNGTITGVTVGGLPDGIVDTDMLAANAVSSAKLASGVGGKILQVVQNFKNDTFSTSSTDTLVDITGFNITITPSSSSNKILLMSSCGIGLGTSSTVVHMELFRGSTQIALSASSSQNYYGTATQYPYNREAQVRWSYNFLDTPNTTSAVTYQWKCKSRSNSAYINNRFTEDMGTTATVIAMEVAA